MNYSEFVKDDKYGAFTEFISVKEAKAIELIPESFWSVFPEKCE